MDYFPTPSGKPYFTFRQGPVFFLFLDGGEDKPDSDIEYGGLSYFDEYREEQAEWLQQVVESEEFKSAPRSEEHTSELQSRGHLVCRLLLEKNNKREDR